jgi:polysaccharide export outer membrane protein
MMRSLIGLTTTRTALVLLILAALLHGPAAGQSQDQQPGPIEYRMGVGDVLEVAVWKDEALTRTVPVRPDGRISLPLVNDVTAAGLTPAALRDAIAAKLTAFMAEPVVSVIVREVRSFKVSVIGQVKNPGRVDITGPMTLLDSIAQAGGFTEFANRSRIVLMRVENRQQRRFEVDYNRIISGYGTDNYALLPGDIVVVP